ncbi:MAG: prepilin-type N-terminal cleavage/methylation domain-containing protein [Elusimicrobiaceae bacterium]|nr:prepilin-type N-terminal cleavage/methylation domain-containing protein [Elusimicrobiaceae bacterium]
MEHKFKNRLGGFSLMELLVIVVIMGVLATVALPKYRKVIESRKTTEAESILSAVRTEQERRCAMDKPYITEFTKLSELVPSSESNHYSYTLLSSGSGMQARSKGDFSYELRMPSYAGRRVRTVGNVDMPKQIIWGEIGTAAAGM